MKQIKITKYEGNTHYSVYVIDSFGNIWANEQAPCPKQELEARAIKEMIDIDIKNGITPSLD